MKLHLYTGDDLNTLTGYGPGFVTVGTRRIDGPVIVTPKEIITPWMLADPAAPAFADFAPVLALKPALVVFGVGPAFRMPDPRLLAAFSQARIGFEAMDTPAACRTYNVLMGEGRAVAAALLS